MTLPSPTGDSAVKADQVQTTARAKLARSHLQRMFGTWWILAIGLCLFSIGSSGALAGSLEAGGLSFSDELGGFRLISASGSGRVSDPIVLVEEISGIGPAVLTIRQSDTASAKSPSTGVMLRSLVKVVINRSAWRWSGFDLELRSDSNQASVYSDGLSFDQIRMVARPLHSDLFASARTEDEPFDRLRFDQGRVKPEQTVRFTFNLVDVNPRPIFFLAQQPIVLLAEAPRR
ncbi:MAG: hypothetical protein ACR2P3_13790 [Geminicoccaceae bacterium]